MVFLALEVVPVELPSVDFGADVDDPPLRCCLHQVEQQVGEQERSELVERERALDAVFGQLSLGEDVSGVVDEHVEVLVARLDVLGGVADLLLRFEVGEDQVGDAAAVRRACDLVAGGGAAAGVPAQQDESAPAAASA